MSQLLRSLRIRLGCLLGLALAIHALGCSEGEARPIPNGGLEDAPIEIETTFITDGLWMLRGHDSTVTVSIGKDGVLIVDTAGKREVPLIAEAIRALGGDHVDYVINTHFHGDHTEGNAYFRERGAEVVSHLQSARNMREDRWSPRTEADQPTITFRDTWSLEFNGQHIEARHIKDAHTNGDIVIRFREANVVATGDLFVNRGMPYISKGTKGTIDGYLRGQREVLEWIDEETRVVPGHGPLARRTDLELANFNLSRIRGRVSLLKTMRLELETIQELPVTWDWPEDWHQRWVGIEDSQFLKIVYHTLPN